MKLIDLPVREFTDTLASEAPAPGGGSAAALSGASGAALIAMVCALTQGRQQYAGVQAHAAEVQNQAEAIRSRFLRLMDRDTEAFLTISRAYAMPKAAEEEKAARSAAIQQGLALCTQTPLEMMELAAEALALAASLPGRINTSAASDLGVAALSLRAALLGAWLNVRINIAGLKDRPLAESYRQRGQSLLDKALPLSDQIHAAVLALL